MSFLFVFRSYPDIDHMAPPAWKLLEEGEAVHAVISPGYDISGDHRLGLLRRYPKFHLHEVWPPGGLRARGTLRGTVLWALWMLVRHRVRVVAVEWGYGLDAGYDRLPSARGLKSLGRSVARSLRLAPTGDTHQTRINFMVAARLLRRPVVCLPHGLNVKLDLDSTQEAKDRVASQQLDWSDRNRFSVYVTNTEHQRRFQIDHARGDPDVLETWGSIRWDRPWFELNRRLAPPFDWPAADADRLKVVFMTPKWKNRVDSGAVASLVRRLQRLDGISLAMKGHARVETRAGDPLRDDPEIDWSRIHDFSDVDSVSLIDAADVVLDIGSSIGLEVVLQGKLLINPSYLHELTTLFDEIPGTCVVARDEDTVVRALEDAAGGNGAQADPAGLHELLRRAVYGEREPFDVPQLYYERLRALANERS